LEYSVKNNYVTGQNKFFIRQLKLGEKTNSLDAIDAPVAMGAALLKDRKGDIRMEVPVEGDLRDPDFRIDSVVASSMVGMVGTVVTSPFKLLGGIVGAASPGELRIVNFSPGSSDLEEPEKQKLSTLAAAFSERPGVSLEIKGTASKMLDRASIAGELLKDEILGSKAAEKRTGAGISGSVTSQRQMHQVLAALHREKIGELPPTLQEPGPEAIRGLEKALVDSIAISDVDYRRLAKRRAEAVESYLVQEGRIEPDRMFVVASAIQEPDTAEAVPVILSLLPR